MRCLRNIGTLYRSLTVAVPVGFAASDRNRARKQGAAGSVLLLFLFAAPLPAQTIAPSIVAKQSNKIAPGSFQNIERHFNAQLSTLFDANEPLDLLGFTHGVQIDNFGVVFTAEVSLIRTPGLSPFQQT